MPGLECARCPQPVVPPSDAGSWLCPQHGDVEPLHPPLPAEGYHLADVASSSQVPVWLAWPLPVDWTVTGVRRTGGTGPARGVAVSFAGPGLASRQAELVVVAEEPGVGLGASYAGLLGPDPGPELASAPCDTTVTADGHLTPMWSLPGEDRAIYVGEAAGCWLWAVVWPVTEWMVVHDDLRLVDLRSADHRRHVDDLPVGALSPRLSR